MFSDATRQGKRFRRMIPRLFQKSRVVQIGEPLKVSEANIQSQLWWFRCFRRLNRALLTLLACIGITAFFVLSIEKAISIFSGCMCFALYSMFFEYISEQKDFVPFRWIIVRDGIWLRSSKDVSRFLPWRSMERIDTKPAKSNRQLSRIDLLTVEAERMTLKAKSDDLLPFVNKLVEILPHAIDPEPLQDLQRQLRHRFLYDAFYNLRDSFMAFGMLLFLPIFMFLHDKFPPAEAGFVTWGAVMGVTLLICVGMFILIRRAFVRRSEQHVERHMQELDEMDVAPLLQEANSHSPHHVFGTPPRVVPPDVRRRLLFSGEPVEMLQFCWLLAFLAVLIGGVLWWEDPAALRYGLLPFRWQPTHGGVIVAIADSSTERAPNGNPPPGGRDVITLEQTLPDGRTIRCRQPSWPNHGNFVVGQKVPLLRYVNDETCLQIDDPIFRRDVRSGLWFILGFGTLFFGGTGGLVIAGYYQRKRAVALLETANVVKYRVRKHKKGNLRKTILKPIGGTGEPLEIPSQGGHYGEMVHVFFNEAKPKQSLIAERLRGDLRYNAETGEIECDPDPLARYAKWSLAALALGIGVVVSRLIWVW